MRGYVIHFYQHTHVLMDGDALNIMFIRAAQNPRPRKFMAPPQMHLQM